MPLHKIAYYDGKSIRTNKIKMDNKIYFARDKSYWYIKYTLQAMFGEKFIPHDIVEYIRKIFIGMLSREYVHTHNYRDFSYRGYHCKNCYKRNDMTKKIPYRWVSSCGIAFWAPHYGKNEAELCKRKYLKNSH